MRYKQQILTLAMMAVLTMLQAPQATAADEYPTDGRIKILRYDANDIFTIYTLYGYQTNIEFAKNEEIQTISVGDRSLWQIIVAGSRIFIRPMDDDVTTNMTVITNLRTYQFDLKSGSGELDKNPRMVYVARFSYPEKNADKIMPTTQASPIAPVAQSAAPEKAYRPLMTPPPAEPIKTITPTVTTPPVQTAAPLAQSPTPAVQTATPYTTSPTVKNLSLPQKSDMMQPVSRPLNYLYTYTGPDNLAPVQVYDNGRETFMRFENKAGALPEILLMDDKGNLHAATTRIENGFLVIDGVEPRMVLSYPSTEKQAVYVYNEAMNPGDISHGE